MVQGFTPPKPDFTFTPDGGNFNTVFTFDAGSTFDAEEEDNLLTYSWDFDYDQKFDVMLEGNPVASHQFDHEGKYKVNLLVTDTSRMWARTFREVTVNRIDTLIVPVLKVTPQFPSDFDTVRISAAGSYYRDVPGVMFKYSWRRPAAPGQSHPMILYSSGPARLKVSMPQ